MNIKVAMTPTSFIVNVTPRNTGADHIIDVTHPPHPNDLYQARRIGAKLMMELVTHELRLVSEAHWRKEAQPIPAYNEVERGADVL